MVSLNKEYNQIVNLIKFNVNFSKFIHNNDLLSHSPDYILEKYNHWIGFEPTIECKMYTPDEMTDFFLKYWKRWGIFEEYSVKNILMYLYSTRSMNLVLMSEKFEEYIGPMNMISDIPDKKGLHHKSDLFINDVLEKNKDNVKVVLRDMKIGSII
jgi:hypothetical protein